MQIRNRMTNVRSSAEWESYARLLDHLEGTVNWKYVERTKKYEKLKNDYARLESRRQLMKQLRKNQNIKTLAFCIR